MENTRTMAIQAKAPPQICSWHPPSFCLSIPRILGSLTRSLSNWQFAKLAVCKTGSLQNWQFAKLLYTRRTSSRCWKRFWRRKLRRSPISRSSRISRTGLNCTVSAWIFPWRTAKGRSTPWRCRPAAPMTWSAGSGITRVPWTGEPWRYFAKLLYPSHKAQRFSPCSCCVYYTRIRSKKQLFLPTHCRPPARRCHLFGSGFGKENCGDHLYREAAGYQGLSTSRVTKSFCLT